MIDVWDRLLAEIRRAVVAGQLRGLVGYGVDAIEVLLRLSPVDQATGFLEFLKTAASIFADLWIAVMQL